MFSCFCGTDTLTNRLLKKSLKNVKPQTKKALNGQQSKAALPAQPHNVVEEKQACTQPSCLSGAFTTSPAATRGLPQPDSPIQHRLTGKQLRDRPNAAQLQLARESFINALTSALEVASSNKEVQIAEIESPVANSSGPSSPSSRTFSIQRSLSGANSEDGSSGDESESRHSARSNQGSTHDSCGSWKVPIGKGSKGFTVVVVPNAPAPAEIASETRSVQPPTVGEPLEATRMLRVRTAFEDFKSKRAQLKTVEDASPKEVRDVAEEQAWARQAMDASRALQEQLPTSHLPAPMRREFEQTTAELEAQAVETLSESDSEDGVTPVGMVTLSAAEQAEIDATLAIRPSIARNSVFQEAFPTSPMTPLMTPPVTRPVQAREPDFSSIVDNCLVNIRTMASRTATQLEEDEEDFVTMHHNPLACANRINAACSASIANSSRPLPRITSCPQTDAQACCGNSLAADDEEPKAEAASLTCICSMIAELQLSDVLRCPRCQPRTQLPAIKSLSTQKPPRHPGHAYRNAGLQRMRVAV